MNVNLVILGGRLTRDPQMKFLPSNSAVAEFGLAVNRKWQSPDGNDHEDVAFVDIVAYGKQAELINQHFHKGKEIYIHGRLKYEAWEDKQDGSRRSKLVVVVERFEFVGPRTGGETGDAQEPAGEVPGTSEPKRRARRSGRRRENQ